jgi:4-hydroxy-3-polyprenylbenzoate decarboxylase
MSPMGYRNLRACVNDLQRTGQLIRIEQEIDPYLEAAAIHRRVYKAKGPAVFYARIKGSPFPMVSNLFGTLERTRFLFRDRLAAVRRLVVLKVDPGVLARRPWRYRDVPFSAWYLRPKLVGSGPLVAHTTTIGSLPQLQCWPCDGGAFVTLPLVYTEDAEKPGWRHSNLGMYRVQMSGNDYAPDREVGLHYQIHRGIGVHHAAAIRQKVPFRANVFIGGPPALILAGVMPLPEGLPEIAFAGALGGHRVRLIKQADQLLLIAEADFCISGTVDPQRQLPEGPFGDHLGYYSLSHPFPLLNVERVYHRPDAIWPFTVVGRPPQEDTNFGAIIHELTGPIIPTVLPGIHAVHAVDAAGVHPLLLAVGSERYVPYGERKKPQELLTAANAILGQGQLSLAKYLLIVAREDNPELDIHDIEAFFRHLLERVDWRTDLHFQTCTTIDTLDYSGTGLNEGSKVVIAAVGPPRRQLAREIPSGLALSSEFSSAKMCIPGVMAVTAPAVATGGEVVIERFCREITSANLAERLPLVVLTDNADFAARSLSNFLWVTFTRSNPAADILGVDAFVKDKHWGCSGPLVIDARRKPHHAPVLEPDPAVEKRVDALAAPGGPLHDVCRRL